MYLNEESVGMALKELKNERQDLFLTSKCELLRSSFIALTRCAGTDSFLTGGAETFRWFRERFRYQSSDVVG